MSSIAWALTLSNDQIVHAHSDILQVVSSHEQADAEDTKQGNESEQAKAELHAEHM